MLIPRVLVLAVVVIGLASCSATVEPADSTNAVAAYIHVSADIFENGAVIEPLTRAAPGQPSEPAGFIRGLRAAGRQEAADGVYGWELIFQSDITEQQRLNLESRAANLGLTVIWLNGDDEWPYCAGEERCRQVKQSGDFP